MNLNRTDAICIAIIILVIGGAISALVYSWYTEQQDEPKEKKKDVLFVLEDDLITCDFTEYIWSKDVDGNIGYCVYQTTKKEVAEDESIPKCVTFQSILVNSTGAPISREQLTAIVGNDLISEVNAGFNQMVLDMKVSQTKTEEIPSSLGYGEKNQSMIETIPLLDRVPLYITVDRADFEADYPEELPLLPGKSFKHNYWDWLIKIDSITENSVTFKNSPEVDDGIDIFPWNATVVNISSSTGYIWIRHKPDQSIINSPIDIESMEFYNPVFKEIKSNIYSYQQPFPGIIISIQNGIQMDFNRENIGKNLRYEITIVSIERD
jgi:FKBP-type peptidyl-prolyl cis-trans isomerase 2